MSNFKEYPIYKKRDGQSFQYVSYIFADSFDAAKKEFANNMTKGNHEQSNNIVWLDAETDGVKETGFYDFSGGCPEFNEETEKYNSDEAENFLFCSEKAIKEGFDSWTEDVYTWELREPLDYIEIYDMEDFENNKEDYSFFMACEGCRFYLYNGEFNPISETEGFGHYSDTNDKFMGSRVDDLQFIETYFN